MAKQPRWNIRVGRKGKLLAHFSVPAHKLMKGGSLDIFLKAIVVRNRTKTPKQMLPFYVNKSRGLPSHLPFAEVRYCPDLEKRLVGYFCGDWESWATAMQELDAATADAVRAELDRTKTHLAWFEVLPSA